MRLFAAHKLNTAHRILKGFVKPPTATAGEAFREAYFDAISEQDFERSLNTMAVGPYWLTFAFLPLLERWKSSPVGSRLAPQIIMTTSMNGWTKVSTQIAFLHRGRKYKLLIPDSCAPGSKHVWKVLPLHVLQVGTWTRDGLSRP